MYFYSQYNKIYLSDDYPNFLRQQNIVFVSIGKPNAEKRPEFEKKIIMNENRKTIDSYNNLLEILNIKNKKIEQNLFNTFLEDQNIGAKRAKSFDIDRCNEVVQKSTNPKTKQNFKNLKLKRR